MLLRYAMGSAIRRLRLAKGLTLREISQASAISLPYLSEIERGRKEPSSEIVQTVCVVLGITLRQLMRETDVELVAAERAAHLAPVLDLTPRHDDVSIGSIADRLHAERMPVQRMSRAVRRAADTQLLVA
ncbi:helix-turn-helix domain-containing protein [Humibacter ginsenosidimutans]|uniref:Helix-turn-helix transcriptional regulator n=1 Tax=Humibacter ginsenosidimutans TaxID=2599293 RepID=A0A5B8M819_9MICO|nr:helix-turn-helix transcriptional regulator [Humibacter ginsenosidimutans]QDZ16573.1 helix-turn-helix transcriptional regulator [Humibacter ginsenosidimutans]